MAQYQGRKITKVIFLKSLTQWVLLGFLGKSGFCKKTQVDGFWNFYGFSIG